MIIVLSKALKYTNFFGLVRGSQLEHYYELLVSGKEDFGLADSVVTKAFTKAKTVLSEMVITSFLFKILNNITFSSSQNRLCSGRFLYILWSSETVNHLFYECSRSKQFWKGFGLYYLVNMLKFPCRMF